ncbi:MAG TPA: methanogenesis marker 16 metalloprotein [Methanospirillum sp.]|nr:methanogenesis marker 16 metalloprotein [Methanospirillum sp.]
MNNDGEVRDRIRKKIGNGSAVVLTAHEFKERVEKGEPVLGEVDVVTCGTCGVMSGTYAVLSVPVASPGSFLRADSATLNGVPAFVGPCPNERLGLVDLIVYGTSHATDRYGGGHLFHDLIAGRSVHVAVQSQGKNFETDITGPELPHARLFTTRSAFKNYTAIMNCSTQPVRTIFSSVPLSGSCSEVTVSGCGEINPLENDPTLRFLSVGTPLLVNGGMGYFIGQGTRSSAARPNIAAHGDMASMDAHFCGGFSTSAGPECITSIGTAIPVIDQATVDALSVRDAEITLPVMDISDRQQVSSSSYDRVWSGTSRSIQFDPLACKTCDVCDVRNSCPVDAIKQDGTIHHRQCFACGTCVQICKGKAYSGKFGALNIPFGDIPIVLRQSDRTRGELLCKRLKEMILHEEFPV